MMVTEVGVSEHGNTRAQINKCWTWHTTRNPPSLHPRDTAGKSVLEQPCQKWGILSSCRRQFLGLLSIFFTALLHQIPFFSSLQGNQSRCSKNTVLFLFNSSQSKQLCSIYTFHGCFWHFYLSRNCQNNNSHFACKLIQFASILRSII